MDKTRITTMSGSESYDTITIGQKLKSKDSKANEVLVNIIPNVTYMPYRLSLKTFKSDACLGHLIQ